MQLKAFLKLLINNQLHEPGYSSEVKIGASRLKLGALCSTFR